MTTSPLHLSSDETNAHTMITVDPEIYSKDALMAAAFTFIDRAYIFLDKSDTGQLQVHLRWKEKNKLPELARLEGEFSNELLTQDIRGQLAESNQELLSAIIGHSLASAEVATNPVEEVPQFDLSELEALELDDEPFDDPLGIAVSWEEKYGKNKEKPGESK